MNKFAQISIFVVLGVILISIFVFFGLNDFRGGDDEIGVNFGGREDFDIVAINDFVESNIILLVEEGVFLGRGDSVQSLENYFDGGGRLKRYLNLDVFKEFYDDLVVGDLNYSIEMVDDFFIINLDYEVFFVVGGEIFYLDSFRIKVNRVASKKIGRINSNGVLLEDFKLEFLSGFGEVTIPKGTKATLDGVPIDEISVEFKEVYDGKLVYDLKPDGAKFEPYLVLSINWNNIDFSESVNYADMGIGQWYDENSFVPYVDSNVDFDFFRAEKGFILPQTVEGGKRVPLVFHNLKEKKTSIPVEHFSKFQYGTVLTQYGELVEMDVKFDVRGILQC